MSPAHGQPQAWVPARPLRALQASLRALSLHQRVHLAGLLLITIGAVVHHAVLWTWYIEDAAISFSYARNVSDGEGLVPFPGAERVEGYSNPTWVALLAVVELLGGDAYEGARWLQLILVIVTVPLTYLVGHEARDRDDSHIPLLAAFFLAGFSQYAIWSSSGLENGLFCALLAMALWRLLVESRTGSFPWSALWFFLVAISRPEAILYAAVGGACAMGFTLAGGHGLRPTLLWLATFWVPFGTYHAARYTYFAWEWPNTYYAKLGDHRDPKPFTWNRRGWNYVRDWFDQVALAPFLPLALLGVTGSRSWRPLAAVTLTVLVALAVLLPGDQTLLLPTVLGFCFAMFYTAMASSAPEGRPSPRVAWAGLALVGAFVGAAELMRAQGHESSLPHPTWLNGSQPVVIAAIALALPLFALGQRGWQARVACWAMACVSVFFATWALGDWMKGFRWFSLLSVPLSVILACGASALGDLAQRILGRQPIHWGAAGYSAAVLTAAGWVPGNVNHTLWFDGHRETSPSAIHTRVLFTQGLMRRVFAEPPIGNLDVDQGGHLWWGDFHMLDIAGLIDVPLAQNKFEKPFVEEYVFEEHRPEVAHVHGGWANSSRIPTHEAWKRDYIEVPGYPAGGRSIHPGNFLRRDLVLVENHRGWSQHAPVPFGRHATLIDWRIPSPETAPGRYVFVELALQRGTRADTFRLVAFASRAGELLVSWELPPAYDWMEPSDWRDGEVFVGRFALPTPPTMGSGAYELGFVLLDDLGEVVEPLWIHDTPPDGIDTDAPVFARGEVRFREGGPIGVSVDEASKAAMADREAGIALAAQGDCEGAEHRWWQARMHRPRALDWQAQHRARVARALAECWSARARGGAPVDDAVFEALVKAHDWDHHAPTYLREAVRVSKALHVDGLAARDAERYDQAYVSFDRAARVAPWRAWSRRRAEEMRAIRFGYDPQSKAREALARDQAREKAMERAQQRKREMEERRAEREAPPEVGPPAPPRDGRDAP